jgi:hypothetical protein
VGLFDTVDVVGKHRGVGTLAAIGSAVGGADHVVDGGDLENELLVNSSRVFVLLPDCSYSAVCGLLLLFALLSTVAVDGSSRR